MTSFLHVRLLGVRSPTTDVHTDCLTVTKRISLDICLDTLLGTNIAPENGWLEYYFPIGEAYFHGLC